MVTKDELLQCSIGSWYYQYEKHTFPTILVPLPEEFVSWLLEDGLFLPASNSAFPTRNKQETITAEDDYKDWSAEEEEDAQTTSSSPNFPDLITAIDNAITELGGSVIPKLTWSVPKDATWVAVGNTLRCTTADQVVLLLKSSDRVAHDLTDALAHCSDVIKNKESKNKNIDNDGPTASLNNDDSSIDVQNITSHIHGTISNCPPKGHILALRKWYDLKPGREFRCFVISGKLRGICQRDISRKYEELESEFDSIKERIEQFHKTTINSNTASTSTTTTTTNAGPQGLNIFSASNNNVNFTYDCYVPSSMGSAVKIVDFNPAGGTTAPLLFEWEELLIEKENKTTPETAMAEEEENFENLENLDAVEVEFRILREDIAMRPDTALYGVPYDFVDLSEGSALRSLMEQAQQGNGNDAEE